jgi:hypothetical protein
MRKSAVNPVQKILPVFATLFIVVGLAAIVLSRPKDEVAEPTTNIASHLGATTTGAVTVLQTNDTGVRFLSDDGTIHECPISWTDVRMRRLSKDGLDITAGDDQSHHVAFDCSTSDSMLPRGLLNASGTHGARMGAAKSDGAGVIIFSDGKNETEVVLRDAQSHPYRWSEFQDDIVGWMDDGRLGVVVLQGDGRIALTVEPTGTISKLASLPEEAMQFAAAGGAFWYATVTPGPGIELGPRGPSELHRVQDGKDVIVAKDAEDAIEGLSAGPDHRFAYLAAGTLFTGQEEAKNVGTGRPLGWTDDGTLMVARNGRLTLIAPDAASRTSGVATDTQVMVPDSASGAWRATLDAMPGVQ